MMKTTRGLAAALLAFTGSCAFGQIITVDTPPPELSFLSSILTVRKNIVYEIWSEVRFPPRPDTSPVHRGKHWYIIAETRKPGDVVDLWNAIKPAFLTNGWTVFKELRPGGFLEVLQYSHNGVEAWVNIDYDGSPVIFRLDVIEVAPLPYSLTLAAPAATPEKIAPGKGDFPFLMPLPGCKPHHAGQDNALFYVTPVGAAQSELVGRGLLYRDYFCPGISQPLYLTVYRDAFPKAGWVIAEDRTAVIKAHYGKNGRNIWASVSAVEGGISLVVADTGETELSANFTKACHVALYGVLFDFNKATLQQASDGVLGQVSGMLTADQALKVEVQGHTDNVGNDAYNQTLSDARAKSVVAWLTQHGIAAGRLTAKGYGKTKPVADNGSEEGRAKNRRVEIADPRCTPQTK